jgi:pimeloyl-ACP methyl ester carboxylesterase
MGRDSHSRYCLLMNGIEEWWSSGERVAVELSGTERKIFVRRTGSGPALTLLHGFPSSSYDWARVVDGLAAKRALLLLDFLGFGASEKPSVHDYSITEQADLVEAMWAYAGIATTGILAHDYAVSVTQELLARNAEGRLAVEIDSICLLNGGLYADVYRPQPGQRALLDREQGPQISAQLTEQVWSTALGNTFAAGFDADADLADIWQSMIREDGHRLVHRLIRYMEDREANAERWATSLESTDVPVSFVWGMLDPVSGAHMAERVRERLPDAPFQGLDDVSHWPPLEAPEEVLAALALVRPEPSG